MITLHLDRASPIPLYYQLQQQLLEEIRSGRLKTGDALPTEPDLVTQIGVSRFTVRQALDQLVRDGLLRRERGRGTFVTDPGTGRSDRRYSVDLSLGDGQTEGVEVLRCGPVSPTPEVGGALGLGPGDQAVEIVRLRLAGKEPVSLEKIFLPAKLVANFAASDLSDSELYDRLERRHGLRVTHAQQVIRIVDLDAETARSLGVRPGSAGWHFERRTHAGDTVVELRHSYVPNARSAVRLTLSRADIAGG